MKISEQSFAVFQKSARRDFEARMLTHLRNFAPQLAEIAGDAALLQVVETGIDRAREYGFTLRGPVQFFLELKLSFGSEFDTDPQCFHFHGILRSTGGDEMARARTLFAAAKEYFDFVAGFDDQFARQALFRAREVTQAVSADQPTGSLVDIALNDFREIYPEKYSYLGREALRRLAQKGNEFLASRPPGHPAFGRLVCGLMYCFGSGVFTDPLYPWVQKAVQEFNADPEELTGRLNRKFHLYLTQMSETLK